MDELLQDRVRPAAAGTLAPPGAVPPGPVPPGPARAGRRPDRALLAVPALTLAVTAWGLDTRSYWGDEADTVSAVSRSLPQLFRLLGHVDAVHGLYYLLLWPVARAAGTGELVTRLPSALAMAAAAYGVAVITARLASRRAALCAGLVFAVLPSVSLQAHDARPYAAVTAAAVLASYLLLRVRDDPRRRWLVAYALSLALAGYLQLFALLLVPAHAVTLAGLARRGGAPKPGAPGPGAPGPGPQPAARPAGPVPAQHAAPGVARGWLLAVAAASAALVPVAVAGWAQRAQVGWIPGLSWGDAASLITTLAAGPVAAALLGALAVLGVARGAPPGPDAPPGPARPARELAWLAGPWLVLPPALLLALSVYQPVYNGRYLTYCLPAVALLAGAGIAVLRWPQRAAALALIAALCLPLQLAARTPGGPIEAAAAFLETHARPGDAIVYPQASIPPWYLAYPAGFARVRDLSLAQSPAAAGRLYGAAVPAPVLRRRERDARRIWVVQMGRGRDPAAFLAHRFHLAREWAPRSGYLKIRLYTAARRSGPPIGGRPPRRAAAPGRRAAGPHG